MWPFSEPEWQVAKQKKLLEREHGTESFFASLPEPERDVSPADDLPYLSAGASEITRRISAREWTARRVLLAYVRATSRTSSRTNAVSEVLYARALATASRLDKELEATGELQGPLHGVPMTIKDLFHVKGVDTAIGFSAYINEPAVEDGWVVSALDSAGAVIFAKTAVPQTMLTFECSSPLLGISTNPHDPSRTPGGSSGGEASLIGSDCSVAGVGTDVGGSCRIPAHYSGCFGIKPTPGRLAREGIRLVNPGFEALKDTIGSLARNSEDLETVAKVLINASARQASLPASTPRLPFSSVQLPERLRIGYFLDDGFCRASPACARAVEQSVDALRAQGHELVLFTPPRMIDALELFVSLTSADGYSTLLSHLRSDPVDRSLFLTTLGPKIPWLVRAPVCWLLSRVIADETMSRLVYASRVKSVRELMAEQARRSELSSEALKTLWHGSNAFDFVLCPVQATPALKIGETADLSPLSGATFYWNVIDSSAGVVPVTKVDRKRDALPGDWLSARASTASKLVESRVYKDGVYDAEAMHGLPVGVQVVAPPHEDEKLLRFMRILDDALGPRSFGPGEFAKAQAKKEE